MKNKEYKKINFNNKKTFVKAHIYLAKTKKEMIRKISLIFGGFEFDQYFYNKNTFKLYVNFLKEHNIPINIDRANYSTTKGAETLPF